MSIKKQSIQNYYLYDTEVENLFISEYMPSAPENAVKLYLLALMHLGSGMPLTPDLAARKLGISLSQVDDAWTYWQKIGIARRTVRDPGRPQEYEIELLNIREMMYGRRPDAAPAAQEAPFALDDEAFSKLLRDIESTTGRLLEAREPEEVASWIAEYGMAPEVIILGYKYCTQRGKSNRCRYVAAILKDWRAKGLVTAAQVEDSLASADRHYQFYRAVMKELGFHRSATEPEKRIMDTWFDKMGCSLDDVMDACRKTTGISNPNINYVNSVLVARYNEANEAKQAEGGRPSEETIFSKVNAMYEQIRQENERKTEAQRAAVFAKIPRMKTLNEEIKSSGIAISRAMLRGGAGSPAVARERARYEALGKERSALLAKAGFAPNALDTIYSCSKCRDTGVLDDGSRCQCFKEKAELVIRNNG